MLSQISEMRLAVMSSYSCASTGGGFFVDKVSSDSVQISGEIASYLRKRAPICTRCIGFGTVSKGVPYQDLKIDFAQVKTICRFDVPFYPVRGKPLSRKSILLCFIKSLGTSS